jgi:hypothetical protein
VICDGKGKKNLYECRNCDEYVTRDNGNGKIRRKLKPIQNAKNKNRKNKCSFISDTKIIAE